MALNKAWLPFILQNCAKMRWRLSFLDVSQGLWLNGDSESRGGHVLVTNRLVINGRQFYFG
jgi:hypothetical protein